MESCPRLSIINVSVATLFCEVCGVGLDGIFCQWH